MDQQELAAALGRKYDDNYKKVLAEVEANQRKIAKQNEGYERSIDGLSSRVMSLDIEAAVRLQKQHGQGCLNDPDFIDWHRKNHPDTSVNSKGTKSCQVGYTGR